VCVPVNAAFTARELAAMLKKVKAKAIFTVVPLLDVARRAAKLSRIDDRRVYVWDMPGLSNPPGVVTVSHLLNVGSSRPALKPLRWPPGEAERRIAFLSHSSGTTGLPVGFSFLNTTNFIDFTW
jgi:acyl-CoA synthetase (AMP-forming)/AMP-acid ligase II